MALLAILAACTGKSGEGGGGPAPGGRTYEIAVVPKGTTHVFWKMIHAGARKAEKEINAAGKVRVKIHWQGPLKEDNTQDQIDLVRNFIVRGVDGMCLAPNDKSALVPAVRDVTKAGIPVVVFDSGLDAKVGEDFASYVATDNYKGGVLGAKRLGEVLGGKGKVILLRFMVGSESTMQREQGFLDTIAKEFPEIEVISKDQYAGATENEAFKRAQNLLTRFQDEADGLFCPNESAAAGTLEAVRAAGLAKKLHIVGFDASEKLVKALRDREIDGLVLQNPIKMTYEAVHVVVRKLEGATDVPPYVDTGVEMATPDNVDTPAMVELHSPDLSQWLGE